jgi:hypothetical protein
MFSIFFRAAARIKMGKQIAAAIKSGDGEKIVAMSQNVWGNLPLWRHPAQPLIKLAAALAQQPGPVAGVVRLYDDAYMFSKRGKEFQHVFDGLLQCAERLPAREHIDICTRVASSPYAHIDQKGKALDSLVKLAENPVTQIMLSVWAEEAALTCSGDKDKKDKERKRQVVSSLLRKAENLSDADERDLLHWHALAHGVTADQRQEARARLIESGENILEAPDSPQECAVGVLGRQGAEVYYNG